jgi:hypothetical protein
MLKKASWLIQFPLTDKNRRSSAEPGKCQSIHFIAFEVELILTRRGFANHAKW